MTGNAGALLGDRFLRNLNQNFLTLFQQITDERQVLRLAPAELGARASPEPASTIAPLIALPVSWTRNPLRVCSGCSKRAQFSACIHGPVLQAFRSQHCLGLR